LRPPASQNWAAVIAAPTSPAASSSAGARLTPVDPFPYRRLVAQVALQYEPERLALVADELEVRADRAGHPFLVVGRGGHRTADLLHECVAVRVQKS